MVGVFSKTYREADFGQKSGAAYSLEAEFLMLNKQLKNLNNEIDGLNYLTAQGRELIAFTEDQTDGNCQNTGVPYFDGDLIWFIIAKMQNLNFILTLSHLMTLVVG